MGVQRDSKGKFIKGHVFIKGGEKGWFKKGQKPWCAGKTRKEDSRIAQPWLDKKRPGLMKTNAAKTMFKVTKPRRISTNGYVELYDKNKKHPCILEHRKIMENFLGRKLNTGEQVHHINGNKIDNRIENLMLFANASEHTKYHLRGRSN